jgi:hypothetical protein
MKKAVLILLGGKNDEEINRFGNVDHRYSIRSGASCFGE